MSEKPEPETTGLQIRWDPDSAFPSITYANYVQVTYTPEDFTLYLGWYSVPPLHEPPPDNIVTAKVQPVGQVTLPLNLMANLIALLQRQLAQYEANFGDLPDHPNKPSWLVATEKGNDDV